MALRDLLECDVDLVEAAGLRERFRDRVLREAVPL
jgi:predicted nucleotidyltransferase